MDKEFYFHFYRDFYLEYSPLTEKRPSMQGGFHLHNLGELIIVEEGASTMIADGVVKSAAGSYAVLSAACDTSAAERSALRI